MHVKDEVIKRNAAIDLLKQAKEMEILKKKIPVRINKNTVVLVTSEKKSAWDTHLSKVLLHEKIKNNNHRKYSDNELI